MSGEAERSQKSRVSEVSQLVSLSHSSNFAKPTEPCMLYEVFSSRNELYESAKTAIIKVKFNQNKMNGETPRSTTRVTRQDLEAQIGSWLTAGEIINFYDPNKGGGGELRIPKGTQFKIKQYDIHLNRLTIELESGVVVGLRSGCFPAEGIDIEE